MNRTPEKWKGTRRQPIGRAVGDRPTIAESNCLRKLTRPSWGIDRDAFAATLQLSAKKHFVEDIPAVAKLE